jgi:hypothetical protein
MAEMKQVIAPDSPAAVRLALLGGFNADLGDALYGFSIALHLNESQEPTERNLVRRVVSDAIVSYGRCFTSSNVRPRLDEIIDVPEAYADVHHMLKRLRNRTVAHSESTLTPTYAVVDLERDESTGVVRATRALAMSVHASFSGEAIEQFHEVSGALKNLLLLQIEQAKAELIAELDAAGDVADLWNDGTLPQFVDIPLDDWNVDSKRPDYPESHIIPVVVAPARTFLTPSAGDLYEAHGPADTTT